MEAQHKNSDEYIIKDVSPVFLTDESITPNNLPRITQPSFGKYLARVDDKPEPDAGVLEVHSCIMNKWLERNKAFWVTAPHKNDCVLKMQKKYSRTYNYHPRNTFTLPIFTRPYECELDFVEFQHLKNIDIIEARYNKNIEKRTDKATTEKYTCKFTPPFWWKATTSKSQAETNISQKESVGVDKRKELRWKPIADFMGAEYRTDCQRRMELLEVGLPYKHEVLKFYSEHFPAPAMKKISEHFSK